MAGPNNQTYKQSDYPSLFLSPSSCTTSKSEKKKIIAVQMLRIKFEISMDLCRNG